MKMIVKETENGGLMSLLGKRVLLMCSSYFYSGRLVGVNDTDVKLEDAGIVYETGPWTEKGFKDEQPVGGVMYVRTAHIEAYKEA